MLEFCLREERIKYARLLQTKSGVSADNDGDAPVNIIDSVLEKANLNATLYERIAKRRARVLVDRQLGVLVGSHKSIYVIA